MKPINSKYFGSGSGKIRIRFHNGTSVVDGFIVKQIGETKYIASHGGNDYVVRLTKDNAEAANLTSGVGVIRINNFAGSAAAYTVRMGMLGALITNGGSGYSVGNVLTVVGGTGTAATVTVTAVGAGGAITAVTTTTAGLYTALPGTLSGNIRGGITTTGGSGTGFTFEARFNVDSVVVTSAGLNYEVGDTVALTIPAGSAVTAPVLTVGAVNAQGGITSVTVSNAGDFGGLPTTPSTPDFEYVRKLWSTRCRTLDGNTYAWKLGTAGVNSEADIQRI